MRASLIVTAAGSSTRFNNSFASAKKSAGLNPTGKSKIFFELGGVAVLERTLKAFSEISPIKETLVTVPQGFEREAASWARARGFNKIQWVAGGQTRAESVLNALKKTSPLNSFVIVHDGARPLIASQTIRKMLTKVGPYDGILLARRVIPTLKKISPNGTRVEGTIDRSQLAEAETPQIIKRKALLDAYRKLPYSLSFTDESSLIEAAGGKMGVFLHTDWNPKLTHYSDFELAEAKLNSSAEFRVGNGYDIHRLVSGKKLWIGGLKVPFEKGSLGHSDGDALLHSITDAVLGSLGLGDIGDWFSDQDPKFKNIQSSKLLIRVLQEAQKMGWKPSQVDSNVILEKPKLGLFKVQVRKSLAKLLDLPIERVSVKARTYEGLPPFGTSEAWACQSIVVMRKII